MAKEEKKQVSLLSSQIWIPVTVITSSILGSFYIYRAFLRRIPNSRRIPDHFYHKRTLYGKVTSVGDADNFHLYHTPGGILGGWGWLRHAPATNTRGLAGQTIHVRLCGIDAPEGAHFGKPAQPHSKEALEWLREYLLGKKVRVLPLAPDQYMRTVGEARVWKFTGRKNVSLEMLRNGWAVVYETKLGSEFNGNEAKFRQVEQQSRKKRIGIFQNKKLVTPEIDGYEETIL